MAVTFKEALEIVRSYNDEHDYCVEEPDAFTFFVDDDYSIGGTTPAAVIKETGECINYVSYVYEKHPREVIKEGRIEDWER